MSGPTSRRLDLRRGLPRASSSRRRPAGSPRDLGVGPDAAVYDISNACLGVLNGMVDIANRIELGQIRAGLVVSCETAREINDIMIERMLPGPDHGLLQAVAGHADRRLGGGRRAADRWLVLRASGGAGCWAGSTQTAPQFHGLCRWGIEALAAAGPRTSFFSSSRPTRPPCSSTASSWACGPGRPSSEARLGQGPDRQGDLPPGRRSAPRHDPPGRWGSTWRRSSPRSPTSATSAPSRSP